MASPLQVHFLGFTALVSGSLVRILQVSLRQKNISHQTFGIYQHELSTRLQRIWFILFAHHHPGWWGAGWCIFARHRHVHAHKFTTQTWQYDCCTNYGNPPVNLLQKRLGQSSKFSTDGHRSKWIFHPSTTSRVFFWGIGLVNLPWLVHQFMLSNPMNIYGSVSKPCTPGEHQNSW